MASYRLSTCASGYAHDRCGTQGSLVTGSYPERVDGSGAVFKKLVRRERCAETAVAWGVRYTQLGKMLLREEGRLTTHQVDVDLLGLEAGEHRDAERVVVRVLRTTLLADADRTQPPAIPCGRASTECSSSATHKSGGRGWSTASRNAPFPFVQKRVASGSTHRPPLLWLSPIIRSSIRWLGRASGTRFIREVPASTRRPNMAWAVSAGLRTADGPRKAHEMKAGQETAGCSWANAPVAGNSPANTSTRAS